MDSKFLKFADPLLNYIDKGDFFRKPFRFLYMILGVLSLIAPLAFLWTMIEGKMLSGTAGVTIGIILLFLILCFAHWIVFQIWWSRKDKVNQANTDDDEFISTPVFAHFIQTGGEAFGIWTAIVGAGFSLISTILLGDAARAIGQNISVSSTDYGILGVVILPIIGFIIVVFSRFLAEQVKALATIANNTKK